MSVKKEFVHIHDVQMNLGSNTQTGKITALILETIHVETAFIEA